MDILLNIFQLKQTVVELFSILKKSMNYTTRSNIKISKKVGTSVHFNRKILKVLI